MVDTLEKFNKMKIEIEQVKVIAFDSEWTNSFVSGTEQYLDVFQISIGKFN